MNPEDLDDGLSQERAPIDGEVGTIVGRMPADEYGEFQNEEKAK